MGASTNKNYWWWWWWWRWRRRPFCGRLWCEIDLVFLNLGFPKIIDFPAKSESHISSSSEWPENVDGPSLAPLPLCHCPTSCACRWVDATGQDLRASWWSKSILDLSRYCSTNLSIRIPTIGNRKPHSGWAWPDRSHRIAPPCFFSLTVMSCSNAQP